MDPLWRRSLCLFVNELLDSSASKAEKEAVVNQKLSFVQSFRTVVAASDDQNQRLEMAIGELLGFEGRVAEKKVVDGLDFMITRLQKLLTDLVELEETR